MRSEALLAIAGYPLQARRQGDLPDTFVIWISSRSENPEQDLSRVEHTEIEHRVNVAPPHQHIVSPDLVVGFGYDAEHDERNVALWDQRSFAANCAKISE